MDITGSTRHRHGGTPSSDRFLAAYPHATTSTEETELHEDDIFSTGDFSTSTWPPNHHHQTNHFNNNSPPSPSCATLRHLNNHKSFPQAESFGILAALPSNLQQNHHHLYQKSNLSSSSSSTSSTSSARLIPTIPKPTQERIPISGSFSKVHYHQSAPVNVPVLTAEMMNSRRRRNKEFEEIGEDDEEDGGDGERLPPHEIVARAQSPLVSCSVLEGVGRTLKGRDLRQVRNAIWRKTGFLD